MTTWLKWCVAALGVLAPITLQADTYDLVKTYYGGKGSWLYGWSLAQTGNNSFAAGSIQDNTFGYAAGAAYQMDAGSGNILRTFANPEHFPPPLPPSEPYANFGNAVLSAGNGTLLGRGDVGGAYVRPQRDLPRRGVPL